MQTQIKDTLQLTGLTTKASRWCTCYIVSGFKIYLKPITWRKSVGFRMKSWNHGGLWMIVETLHYDGKNIAKTH